MTETLEFNVHFERGQRGHWRLQQGECGPPPAVPGGRVPRISRLMALAIRLERLLASGEVKNYADIAKLGHVTRARMTQIMSLGLLAPDIQERLLDLPPVERGRDPITERQLRPVIETADWQEQRRLFSKLMG
jgi:hypothetical protein